MDPFKLWSLISEIFIGLAFVFFVASLLYDGERDKWDELEKEIMFSPSSEPQRKTEERLRNEIRLKAWKRKSEGLCGGS